MYLQILENIDLLKYDFVNILYACNVYNKNHICKFLNIYKSICKKTFFFKKMENKYNEKNMSENNPFFGQNKTTARNM